MMSCPPEIAAILLRIMTHGLLHIRYYANDPRRCFNESDHLHNLPDLVEDYSRSKLLYYWNVERPIFISKATGDGNLFVFEPLWEELRPHVEPPRDHGRVEYLVVVEPVGDGGFGVYVPDLPGCVSHGNSVEDALTQSREAILWHIESLCRHNEPVPPPSAIGQSVMIDLP